MSELCAMSEVCARQRSRMRDVGEPASRMRDVGAPADLKLRCVELQSAASDESDPRWHVFTTFLQVHTHLQAAAMKLFPGRNFLLPTDVYANRYIGTIVTYDGSEPAKFDLAQTWLLHSPSSYVTPYGFRRALTGENQDTPSPELDNVKYPSLVYVKYWPSESPAKFKYRAMLNAEDTIKFLVSDFARKGQHNEIFEAPRAPACGGSWTGPTELVQLMAEFGDEPNHSPTATEGSPRKASLAASLTGCSARSTREHREAKQLTLEDCLRRAKMGKEACPPPAPFTAPYAQHISDLDRLFRSRTEILQDAQDEGATKRRKVLANEAMRSLTRVLLDANLLLLDAAASQ